MSPREPSAPFPAPNRARATILAIGVGIVLLMHVLQPVLLREYQRALYVELCYSFVSTVTQLTVATLLARRLERREMSVIRVALAVCLAVMMVSTAFAFGQTLLLGIVGMERIRYLIMAGGFGGIQLCGLWVLAFRYPLLVDEARVRALEMQRTRQAAELAHLRGHLQPHFLRNSLNAIAALITEEPSEARNLLAALGDLLSETIQDASPFRTLAEEMHWLKQYAEILEVRYRGALRCVWNEDPSASNARVPRMLLQPLLENAIHHGALARDGEGHVIVTTHAQKGGGVKIEVQDNGPGFDPNQARKDGLGLRLVRRRLEMEVGGELRMESNASGTRAIVVLP